MWSKVRTLALALFLLASLALNVATVTVQSVATGVSAVVSTVAGASAILPEFRMVTYKGQPKRLSAAVRETSERIAKRTAKSATRSAGSVIAEAIPVAGIAVVVGVTAWELKDSCDTMLDLYELERATTPTSEFKDQAAHVCGLETPTKEEVLTAIKSSPGKAWAAASSLVPDLPEMPEVQAFPSIDWKAYIPDLPKLPDPPSINWPWK